MNVFIKKINNLNFKARNKLIKILNYFKLKNSSFKTLLILIILATIGSGFFIVYGQMGGSGSSPSLTKGLIAHYTLDAQDYEEGTVNLAPNTNYSNRNYNQVYNPSCWGGDIATVEYFESGGYNNLPYKKLTKTGGGTGGCYIDEHYGINIQNNKTYVISAYVKASRNISSVPPYVIGLNRTADNSYRNGPYLNLTTEWKRYSWTYNSGSDHAGIYSNRGIIYENNDLPIEVYWSGFQVEEKPYVTPFVNGTRIDRVVDKTPYSNHGTNYGATPTTDRHGKEGGAMSFDGVSNNIQTNLNISSNQDVTYSIWFNRLSTTGVRTLIGSDNNNGTIRMTDGSLQVYWDGSSNAQTVGATVSQNNWHNLVVVKTSTKLKFYLNNEFIKELSVVNTSLNNIKIGHQGAQASRYWSGLIDDFRVYNRALSEEEIGLLFESYQPKIKTSSINSGLIGHWTLSEWDHDNNRIIDKTPYENHGTNYGASFTKDRHEKEGGAMSFNASGNKISIEKPVGKSGFLTVSVWYKRDDSFSSGSWRTIIGHKTGNIHHLISQSTNRNLGIWDGVFRDFGHTPKDKEWEHYVVIYNSGTDATLYVDGQYKSKVNTSLNLLTNPIGMIGNWNSNSYWSGSIDDVRIYDRALSENEISLLYNSYSPQSGGDTLQKGLILDVPLTDKYMKSSNVVTDKTPYSNNGIIHYGAVINNDKASFDGVDDFINFGTGEKYFPLPYFSISTWINPKGKIPGTADNPGIFGFTYGIRLLSSENRLSFGLDNGSVSSYLQSPSTYNFYNNNEWNHVVVMASPTQRKMYINGELVGTLNDTWTGSTRWPTNNWNLGRDNNNNNQYFYGDVADLKMYNRLLSDKEVSLLYAQGAANLGGIPTQYKSSCKEILLAGESNGDGIYKIKTSHGKEVLDVYCDMTTDGGGWTLVLLNNKGLTSPAPTWTNAVNTSNITGTFGTDLTAFDLFLGVDHWSKLGSKMRLQIGSSPTNLTNKAIYSGFSLTGPNYTLGMTGQSIILGSGSSGMFSFHVGSDLSTKDADNDIHSSHCSVNYGGTPWWYRNCWSGSFWGYNLLEGPRWTSSVAGADSQYGSIWIGQ